MPSLLESLLGQPYMPGEMAMLMQDGMANAPPHQVDPAIIARAKANVMGGGGGAPGGYVSPGPITGNLNRQAPEGMAYSSHAPWQPPLNTGLGIQDNEPVVMPQVDVVPGYSKRGTYPPEHAEHWFMDDGTRVPVDVWRQTAGKSRLMAQMNAGGDDDPEAGPLLQSLAGSAPQDDGFNRYLPGMPSEAERNRMVMMNAMARKEGRLARMGEPSPMRMAMIQQAMNSGGGEDGGMNPMFAGMMGGPAAFNVALQNQGLAERARMALGPQQMEAEARMKAAEADAGFKQWMMSPEGQKFALAREGAKSAAVPGSREWLLEKAQAAPDFEAFSNIAKSYGVDPEQARQVWMETKFQDPTAPPGPGLFESLVHGLGLEDGIPF